MGSPMYCGQKQMPVTMYLEHFKKILHNCATKYKFKFKNFFYNQEG